MNSKFADKTLRWLGALVLLVLLSAAAKGVSKLTRDLTASNNGNSRSLSERGVSPKQTWGLESRVMNQLNGQKTVLPRQ
jgi:hypothetical protein